MGDPLSAGIMAGGGFAGALVDWLANRGLRRDQRTNIQLQNYFLKQLMEMAPQFKGDIQKYGPMLQQLITQFAGGNVPNATDEYFRTMFNPQTAQISNAQREALKNISQQLSRSGLNASSLFAKTYQDQAERGAMARNEAYAGAKGSQLSNKTAAMGLGMQGASNQYANALAGLGRNAVTGGSLAMQQYDQMNKWQTGGSAGAMVGSAMLPLLQWLGNRGGYPDISGIPSGITRSVPRTWSIPDYFTPKTSWPV